MTSAATTVKKYLASLPKDRREALQTIRETILANLPEGYDEGMQYGMIGYGVPHSIYPAGYHCDPKLRLPLLSLASQKNHMAIYMFCLYLDRDHLNRFADAWTQTGKKLDMGASCIRFKKVEDVPLDVLGSEIASIPVEKLIEAYEASRTKKR